MENDYSKREIDKYFMDINEKIDINHKENHDAWVRTADSVDALGVKVEKTNGSVGNLKAWRTGISMVVAVLAFIVIPLIIYSFQLSQENLKNSILLEINK